MVVRGRYTPRVKVQQVYSPIEIVKDGNQIGDDDNWRFAIVGDNLERQVLISGVWKRAGGFERPEV